MMLVYTPSRTRQRHQMGLAMLHEPHAHRRPALGLSTGHGPERSRLAPRAVVADGDIDPPDDDKGRGLGPAPELGLDGGLAVGETVILLTSPFHPY